MKILQEGEKMKITNELFVIPNKENYILYAPLKSAVLEVNASTIPLLQSIKKGDYSGGNEETIAKLRAKGIIGEENESLTKCAEEADFKPNSVTLFPTSNCNLNCSYCYASAGETHDYMDMDTAKSSIDFIVKNALETGKKDIRVGFHGGGEPFAHYSLIKESIEYSQSKAKENNLKLNTSSATNGILNKNQLEWILGNIGHLNISLDGPKDVQDKQRPLKGEGSSYDKVIETLDYLNRKKYDYSIRSTITNLNVERMTEMIDLFKDICPKKEYHFEPVFECGRCQKTGLKEPDTKLFIEKIIEVKEYAGKKGIDIYYSGGKIDSTINKFCGAAGKNFCVTPTGDVTSCFEVSKKDDPRAKIFFFGKVQDKKIEIYQDRLETLKSRDVDNMPYCSDCFMKFNCAGDCLAKVASQGDMFNPNCNKRCAINRALGNYEINKLLKNGK